MPAKSAAQKRLMDAAAHNPAFAKKVGIPSKVAKEFSSESKGMKFRKGDEMMKKNTSRMNKLEEMGRLNAEKAKTPMGKKNLMAEKKRVLGDIKGMKKGGMATSKMGAVKTAAPSRDGVAVKGKTRGKMVTMRKGGAC